MRTNSVETLIRRFNEAGVRYLIAGGFAVVAHGYSRFTVDLDFVLDLEPENAAKALEILKDEGYAPTIPVPIEQFADAELRKDWAENRNMVAFPLQSEKHRETRVDVFVREPFDFERAYAERFRGDIVPELLADFVSFEDLMKLKTEAGRPKDLQDIYYLRQIKLP